LNIERGFFVTGTDTNVGKTWSTLALMRKLQRQGLKVAGMKPVAAGCEWRDGGWKNADALLLQQHSSVACEYHLINPYAFEQAVSPHVACQEQSIDLQVVRQAYTQLQTAVDVVVVEGAGGWYSPVDGKLANVDLAVELGLPVIMVVAMRLGCINHALLTWRAIRQSAVPCAGWLAVAVEPQMTVFQENLNYLSAAIDARLLGVLPCLDFPDFDTLATNLRS
jgi:dethiobiotin synthetase